MQMAITLAGVHTHTHTHTHTCISNQIELNASYTLVNKSAVVLSSQELKNKIGKIKIEDSFKKCA